MRRRSLLLASAGAAALRLAHANDAFPSRPVKVVMPYAAGGGPDVQLRRLAPVLGELLGQAVVVENKVGAGGILGAQHVAQAAPDGYTLLYGASAYLIQKGMQPEMKPDLERDFAPVGLAASSPAVLVVSSEGPLRSLDDLVRLGKSQPGRLNYGSGGVGTSAHLASATVAVLGGFQATHIPLRGSVEIQASLQRGDTHFACPIAGTAVPAVKSGVLRALAVTGRQRLKELPSVPTLQELLRNDLAVQETWFGVWAPRATPAPVLARLHAAMQRALASAEVAAAFEAGGSTIATSESPAAFGSFVSREANKWAAIVKLTGTSAT